MLLEQLYYIVVKMIVHSHVTRTIILYRSANNRPLTCYNNNYTKHIYIVVQTMVHSHVTTTIILYSSANDGPLILQQVYSLILRNSICPPELGTCTCSTCSHTSCVDISLLVHLPPPTKMDSTCNTL